MKEHTQGTIGPLGYCSVTTCILAASTKSLVDGRPYCKEHVKERVIPGSITNPGTERVKGSSSGVTCKESYQKKGEKK